MNMNEENNFDKKSRFSSARIFCIIAAVAVCAVLIAAVCLNFFNNRKFTPSLGDSYALESFAELKLFSLTDDWGFDTNKIYLPYYDEEKVSLRDKKEFSNITYFARELYGKPWIWYFCEANGEEFRVQTTYIDEELLSGTSTCSELIKKISPDAPNIDNIEKYENYKSIYEQEIQLSDRKTSALVCVTAGGETKAFFAYDNMLVIVNFKGESVKCDILEKISFKLY